MSPEENVPEKGLQINRYVLSSPGFFETVGETAHPSYTIEDTRGCSCEQIIDKLRLGKGHRKFGCSRGVMNCWAFEVDCV